MCDVIRRWRARWRWRLRGLASGLLHELGRHRRRLVGRCLVCPDRCHLSGGGRGGYVLLTGRRICLGCGIDMGRGHLARELRVSESLHDFGFVVGNYESCRIRLSLDLVEDVAPNRDLGLVEWILWIEGLPDLVLGLKPEPGIRLAIQNVTRNSRWSCPEQINHGAPCLNGGVRPRSKLYP